MHNAHGTGVMGQVMPIDRYAETEWHQPQNFEGVDMPSQTNWVFLIMKNSGKCENAVRSTQLVSIP